MIKITSGIESGLIRTLPRRTALRAATILVGLVVPGIACAQAAEEPSLAFVARNLWLLVAAALVFIMHLGFATLHGFV